MAIKSIVTEYNNQLSPEAKFVKAIDRIESLIQMYDEAGKQWQQEKQFGHKLLAKFVQDSMQPFPVISRFQSVITDRYENEGVFYKEA